MQEKAQFNQMIASQAVPPLSDVAYTMVASDKLKKINQCLTSLDLVKECRKIEILVI